MLATQSPTRLRARSPPNVPKSRVQKAKEVLKKAMKAGRLQELLWGRDGLPKKAKRSTRQSQRVNQAFLDELKQSLHDAMDMDDIAIWNQVLMQRMQHGKNFFREEDNRPMTGEMEVEEDEDEEDDVDSEKDDHVGELPHDDNQLNEDGTVMEKKKSPKKKKKSKKQEKKQEKKKAKASKQKATDEADKRKHSTESESLASRLKHFDTLPVLDTKDKYYVGNVRKPKRVSQIIKDIKTFQQKLNSAGPASPAAISEGEDESDEETNSVSTDDDRFSVASGDIEGGANNVRWGGTTNSASDVKRRLSERKLRNSIDVVAGLFHMSNELRVERENIKTRNTNKDGNDAFINREITLKYNDELDEVAQGKQDSFMQHKRAALLRLRKNAYRYKTYRATHVDRFSTFWNEMAVFRKRIIEPYAAEGDSDSMEEREEKGEDGFEDDANSSAKQLQEAKPIEEIVIQPTHHLESLFEDDLGLLFATKARVSMAAKAKTIRATLGDAGRRDSNASAGQEDGNRTPPSDDTSFKADTIFESDGSVDSIKMVNQRNLAMIIEKMKAMGVYSDSKFRHTYGIAGGAAETIAEEDDDKKDDVEEVGHHAKKEGHPNEHSSEHHPKDGHGSQQVHSNGLTEGHSRHVDQHVTDEPTTTHPEVDEEDPSDEDNLLDRYLQHHEQHPPQHGRDSFRSPSPASNKRRHLLMDDSIVSHDKELDDILASPTFLTELFQHMQSSHQKPFFPDDTDADDVMHAIGIKSALEHAKEPKHHTAGFIHPSTMKSAGKFNNSLKGKWNYDPSVPSTRPFFVEKSEQSFSPVKRLKKGDGAKRTEREMYNFPRQRDHYKELVFNADSRTLMLLTKESDLVLQCAEVAITAVYLTESKFRDMITVRTTDTEQVPGGYIGSFPLQQWILIEEEMNNSLLQLQMSAQRTVQTTDEQDQEEGNRSPVRSAKPIVIPRFSEKKDDLPFVEPIVNQNKYVGNSTVGQYSIPKSAIRQPVSSKERHEMIIANAMSKIRMNPPGSPVFKQPMDAWGNNDAFEQGVVGETLYSSLSEVVEPHRYLDLIPAVQQQFLAAQHPHGRHNTTKPMMLAGDDDHDLGMVVPAEQTLAEKMQFMDTTTFTLAPQAIPFIRPITSEGHAPIPVLPPIMQSSVSYSGYDASGFVACNQPVSLLLKGKPLLPHDTAMAPMKPNAPKSKSFRTQKMSVQFADEQKGPADIPSYISVPSRVSTAPQASNGMADSSDSLNLSPSLPDVFDAYLAQQSADPSTRNTTAGSAGGLNEDGINMDALVDEDGEVVKLEKRGFTYEFQIILLIESRRLMQLYFAKKFLQLDLTVNVHLTPYDATESLLDAPYIYGLIFISYMDLLQFGVESTLRSLIPKSLDKSMYSVFVYDIGSEEYEELSLLESLGVTDILYPPYSIAALKGALDTHQRKQDIVMKYGSGS